MSHRCFRFLLVLLAIGFATTSRVQALSASQQVGALIISFADPDSPDIAALIDEIRLHLQEGGTGPLHLDVEYIGETLLASDPKFQNKLVPYFREKYRGQQFDLVIAIGEKPLEFAQQVRANLFPEATILFALFGDNDGKQWTTAAPARTGVIVKPDYRPTLEVALLQNPTTRRVLVIAGSSKFEQLELSTARQQFKPFESRLKVEYLAGLKLSDLTYRVAREERDSIVIFLDLLADPTGEQFISARTLPLISKSAGRPVYGVLASFVGHGAVGGSVVDLRQIGQVLGSTAHRILKGEKAEDIPVITSDFQRYMFDWSQMRRWRISDVRLPAGSIVLNKEYSAWRRYKWLIAGLLAALSIQALLIALLLRMWWLRREAETRAASQLKLESLIANLAARFVRVGHDLFDAEVKTSFRLIMDRLDIDRISLFEICHDRSKIQLLCSRENTGVQSAPAELQISQFRWLQKKLLEGEPIVAETLQELPPEAQGWIDTLQQQGVKSIVALPLIIGGQVTGTLGFSWMREENHWSPTLLQYLQTFADIFSNALERNKAEEALLNANREQTSILDSAGEGILGLDLEGTHTFVNQAAARLFGYTPKELTGRPSHPIWHSSNHESTAFRKDECPICSSLMDREPRRGNEFFWRRDGSRFPAHYVVTPIGAQGHVTGAVVVVQDISERRRAEEALRLSENKFNKAFHSSPSLIAIATVEECRYIEVNDTYLDTTGYQRSELIGNTSIKLGIWEDPEQLQSLIRVLLQGGTLGNVECRWRMKDMGIRTFLVSLELLSIDGQLCTLASAVDITERKQAEEGVKASEEKFAKIFQSSPSVVALTRLADGCYLDINDTFVQISGYSREEVIGHTTSDLHLWVHADQREGLVRALLQGATVRDVEVRFRSKDGNIHETLFSAELIHMDQDPCMLCSAVDITQRKDTERALRESERRFRLMADSAPVLMWMSGLDRKCTDVNREWLDFTGRTLEQELGDGWTSSVHPADLHLCLTHYYFAFDARQKFSLEYRLRRQDGEYRWLLAHGVPRFLEDDSFAGYIGCCIDVTDQKEAEHARMELSGRLINAQEEERSRIARELHDDINQRLALLANGLQQVEDHTNSARGLLHHEKIRHLVDLASELSADIQHLSHRLHPSKIEYIGLGSALHDLCQEVSRQHGLDIECSVRDVPQEINSNISLSLFRIAQESLRNVVKHSHARHAKVELTSDSELFCLRISDNGIGFDPHASGRVRGLGLLSMRERLRLVGGELSIWSQASMGTQVQATVPIVVNVSDSGSVCDIPNVEKVHARTSV